MAKRDMRSVAPTEPRERAKRDSLETPRYALDPVLKAIEHFRLKWWIPYAKPQKDLIIWEPACGGRNLSRALERAYGTISTDILTGTDFFNDSDIEGIDWNVQVTNPPFTQKFRWLARSYELRKPFALLLPVETLGVATAQDLFKANVSVAYPRGIEVILLNQRVNYKTPNTTWRASRSWFPSAWYTWGLNIGQPLSYGEIDNTRFEDDEL